MKSILDAISEGRLIELPETDKEITLKYLASIIEAIPSVNPNIDISQGVIEREKEASTAIGKGWACPHIRIDGNGELLSVIGWSPSGIDYSSPDNQKVNIIVMFYIPENQKVTYLKELSTLVKFIQVGNGVENILKASNINDVRNELLNWISSSLDSSPQTKVKMLKLEAKQAAADNNPLISDQYKTILPFYLIAGKDIKNIVLSQDEELVKTLENGNFNIDENQELNISKYRILFRSKTLYKPNRTIYDCIAIKVDDK
jgi:mannitol/fructose-specific phosphotransferase system IIA component (Ntr-type)